MPRTSSPISRPTWTRMRGPGRWILTGSEHLGLSGSVSQTLAGRTGILHLLPLGVDELRRFPARRRISSRPSSPAASPHPRPRHPIRPVARRLRPDLPATRCPSHPRGRRPGGVHHVPATPRRAHRVRAQPTPPWVRTPAFRTIRRGPGSPSSRRASSCFACPRGLATHESVSSRRPRSTGWTRGSHASCSVSALLSNLKTHPLRGAIFETWVAAEVYKAHANRGLSPRLYHLRETRGGEVDILVDSGRDLRGIECKSGATVASDALEGLEKLENALGGAAKARRGVLVYGGEKRQRRSSSDIVPWHALSGVDWFGGSAGR